jgi:hypothetical protein
LLLPSRLQRPRRRAAQPRDELAPSHSITSSARASSDCGTVRSSALAVVLLAAHPIQGKNATDRRLADGSVASGFRRRVHPFSRIVHAIVSLCLASATKHAVLCLLRGCEGARYRAPE